MDEVTHGGQGENEVIVTGKDEGESEREEGRASQGHPCSVGETQNPSVSIETNPERNETEQEQGEVGAHSTEKQGHSAFFSPLPFSHLASTKGCYVTAIYTRAPIPSHPPSHVRQHHMKTKWNCSPALLQVLFLTLLASSLNPQVSLLSCYFYI